jgi:multidrug resistance protein
MSSAPQPPSSIRQIWVLMATAFVDMIGFLMVLPLLPFYTERLGGSPATVGALVSAFAFAQLAVSPLWGRASDRYGRKPMILAGLLCSAVAYVVFAYADALWLLFVSRLVQGAGGGTTGVVQAYVADTFRPEERAKALGWLTAATSAGVMIGPLLGSASTYFGEHAPGFVAAGLCLLNLASAWTWLPESKSRTSGASAATPQPNLALITPARRSIRGTMLEVLRHPLAPISALIWIYAMGMMAFMAMNGILALYLGRVFGVTEKNIGWFFTYVGGISLVMRAMLLGPAVKRFGEVGVTRLGALCLVAGFAVLPFAPSIPWLALAVLFIPVGTALLFPATTALISKFAPRAETGQVMGVQQTFGGIARMAGPLWAGAVFQGIGIRYPFWISAALMLGVSFLTRQLTDDKKATAAPVPQPVPEAKAPAREGL